MKPSETTYGFDDNPEAITARRLLVLLANLEQEDLDRPVYLEGCDCVGACFGVVTIEPDERAPCLLLYRADGKMRSEVHRLTVPAAPV